jgi:hypothetical protein
MSTNGMPMLDSDGRLKGYQGSDTDISERVKMEESIQKLNQQIRESLEE